MLDVVYRNARGRLTELVGALILVPVRTRDCHPEGRRAIIST